MNVSFKGFKNAAYHEYLNKHPKIVRYQDGGMYIPTINWKVFHVELDNEKSNDLDEFKSILEKYPDQYDPKMLNIEYCDVFEPQSGLNSQIILNGKEISLTGETLKTFIKLHKVIKKISSLTKNDVPVVPEHLGTPAALYPFFKFSSFIGYAEFGKELQPEYLYHIACQAYNNNNVQYGVKKICQRLSKDLTEFFESGK